MTEKDTQENDYILKIRQDYRINKLKHVNHVNPVKNNHINQCLKKILTDENRS